MDYDILLRLAYEYAAPAAGGQHLARVLPADLPGIQEVVRASLELDPRPAERSEFRDFFGNRVVRAGYRGAHAGLEAVMRARVRVARTPPGLDLSPPLPALAAEIAAVWSLAADAPHHFCGATPYVPPVHEVTRYAARSAVAGRSVRACVEDLCRRIHADFAYDGEATEVDTPLAQAFAQRRGVCQDFTHVMIAGLRGLGIPAGYVSGFLRTVPPPGQPRLEGADATHAWVRAWCGREMGWQEFDPTNAIAAGDDHIVIAYGRDYGDVSLINGVLKTSGAQESSQSVDVLPLA
ncbi:transglutaminase family protein [Xanthomonas massiliensis]|uniref:transglutaminase family protein n=1 Tax=Xanthomonas massiliensis TaxID=1720302 RepID=UPI0008247842|nr:transglutaminase family protein [Xanthomonas massiliensis]